MILERAGRSPKGSTSACTLKCFSIRTLASAQAGNRIQGVERQWSKVDVICLKIPDSFEGDKSIEGHGFKGSTPKGRVESINPEAIRLKGW